MKPDVTADAVTLRFAVAFVWLWTGAAVLHPFYYKTGLKYLEPLGLPAVVMVAACLMEVLLGLRLLIGPSGTWLTGVQLLLIAGFTLILGVPEPALLVNPFGVLSKNVTLVTVIIAVWRLEREGWTLRVGRLLRAGLAFIWAWEGLMACGFFQDETLRAVMVGVGLPVGDPALLLRLAGAGQAVGGLLLLRLRGRSLRALLTLQILGLLVICVLVTRYDPLLWFHPFGPLTKNVPLVAASVVLWRHPHDFFRCPSPPAGG